MVLGAGLKETDAARRKKEFLKRAGGKPIIIEFQLPDFLRGGVRTSRLSFANQFEFTSWLNATKVGNPNFKFKRLQWKWLN